MSEAADVLIVGAGPVGLASAMDLAWRGMRAKVVEFRARHDLPNVNGNHVAARSMENVRRLGIVADIRGAGLPEADGRSPHDALGPDHTMVRTRPAEAGPMMEAARASGVPVALIDLSSERRPDTYPHAMVFVRPDGHVAWRGNAPPDDAARPMDILRGAGHGPAVAKAA